MSQAYIKEILPESTTELWVTLDDNLTRLIDLSVLSRDRRYTALQFPRLSQNSRITDDGHQIYWPSGEFITAEMIQLSSYTSKPVRLLTILPETRRYRPILPLLRGIEPQLHVYLDVRPEQTLRNTLGLKESEWKHLFDACSMIPRELVIARVSDLYLLLIGLFPNIVLLQLMRQQWPVIARNSGSPFICSIADCITNGKFHLVERPLTRLLICPDEPSPTYVGTSPN